MNLEARRHTALADAQVARTIPHSDSGRNSRTARTGKIICSGDRLNDGRRVGNYAEERMAGRRPFISRVRLKNYKSIADCDVALGPLTILIGPNASGKSNFLDALAFLARA